MPFRTCRVTASLIGGLAFFTASGCSYILDDTSTPPQSVKTKSDFEVGSCLNDSLGTLGKYFRKEAGQAQARKTIDCVETSIDRFESTVKGEEADVYQLAEIKTFIEEKFLGGKRLGSKTLPVLFKLKASLIGGSPSKVSKADLQSLRGVLASLRRLVGKLDPHRDLYALSASLEGSTDESVRRIEASIADLQKAAQDLGSHFRGAGRIAFSEDDMRDLLRLNPKLSGAEGYLSFAMALKALLVRPSATMIEPQEWPLLIDRAAQLYGIYLYYHYALKESFFLFSPGFPAFEMAVRRGLILLGEAVQSHPSGRIGVKVWEDVIDQLEILGRPKDPSQPPLLPWIGRVFASVRAASIKSLLPPFFGKVLKSGPDPDQIGLTTAGLKRLTEEIDNWFVGQRMAIQLIDGRSAVELRRVQAELRKMYDILPRHTSLEAAVLRQYVELLSVGTIPRHDRRNRLMLEPPSRSALLTVHDLILLNTIRSAVGAVYRAYSGDQARRAGLHGITRDETQEFYEDVRDLGIDLGLMDPRSRAAGARSFFEGNLFTSVGNGDEILSFHEGVEFFALILSGGRLAMRVYKDAVKVCGDGRIDIFGEEGIGTDCFHHFFARSFGLYFEHAPEMNRFVHSIRDDKDKWAEFTSALERASRTIGVSGEPIERSDIMTMMPIVQYAESIFLKFDRNLDGKLDPSELNAVFQVLKSMIKDLADGKAEDEVTQKAVFAYLVKHHELPESLFSYGKIGYLRVKKSFIERLQFWKDKNPNSVGLDPWDSIDRLAVVKVIASISSATRRARLHALHGYFETIGLRRLEEGLRTRRLDEMLTLSRLFQCPDETVGAFTKMVERRTERLLAPASGEDLTADQFILNVSREMRLDPELGRACQPIM